VNKGDRLTPYPVIKKIMDTLKEIRVNTFSLITDTKSKTD
jgi:biopolymer transport protein ExbD